MIIKTFNINVAKKVATFLQREGGIVCNNSDYAIKFTFDDEWSSHPNKTARFVWNGAYQDVAIKSDNTCAIPPIGGATEVHVGVYVDDLKTTTSAVIPCTPSVKCETSTGQPDQVKEYRDEAAQAAEKAAEDATKAVQEIIESMGIVQTPGDNPNAVMSQRVVTAAFDSISEVSEEVVEEITVAETLFNSKTDEFIDYTVLNDGTLYPVADGFMTPKLNIVGATSVEIEINSFSPHDGGASVRNLVVAQYGADDALLSKEYYEFTAFSADGTQISKSLDLVALFKKAGVSVCKASVNLADGAATFCLVNFKKDKTTGASDEVDVQIKTERLETTTVQKRMIKEDALPPCKEAAEAKEIAESAAESVAQLGGDVAELHDVRIGYDGTEYKTAGEAVRGQIGAIMADREISRSKNLFNKDTLVGQSWAATNNGKIEYYPANQYISDYRRSDYIPVKGGAQYTYSGGATSPLYDATFYSLVWYTEEKEFISAYARKENFHEIAVVTAPDSARYCILNFADKKQDIETVMFEEGTTASEYEPYSEKISYYQDNLLIKRSQIEGETEDEPTDDESVNLLQLPEKYNLVVGDTFELFYKGIMLCKDPYRYNILVTCDIGNAFARKFTATPTTAGTHTLTVQVSDDNGKVVQEQTTQLVVSPKMTSPTSKINVLCVGDSLTAGGQWVDEVYRRLTKTTAVTQHNATAPTGEGLSNIAFIGKKTTPNGAGYEGTGGWKYSDYLSTTNTANPFRYNGAVDFASYCTELGVNKINRCYILLGWNMAGYSENDFKADAKAFINLLLAHNSAIKITLVGIQIPSLDGLGDNYGANGTYSKFRALQEYVFNVDKWNLDIAAEYSGNVSTISISGQFDTENNMPTTDALVNIRSTKTFAMQNNGIHPATEGYYQIADAVYRKFTADNA